MTYYPETETTITFTGGHVLTVRHRLVSIDTACVFEAAIDDSLAHRPDTEDGFIAQRAANRAVTRLILRILEDHCIGDEWRSLVARDAYGLVSAMLSASPLPSTT